MKKKLILELNSLDWFKFNFAQRITNTKCGSTVVCIGSLSPSAYLKWMCSPLIHSFILCPPVFQSKIFEMPNTHLMVWHSNMTCKVNTANSLFFHTVFVHNTGGIREPKTTRRRTNDTQTIEFSVWANSNITTNFGNWWPCKKRLAQYHPAYTSYKCV